MYPCPLRSGHIPAFPFHGACSAVLRSEQFTIVLKAKAKDFVLLSEAVHGIRTGGGLGMPLCFWGHTQTQRCPLLAGFGLTRGLLAKWASQKHLSCRCQSLQLPVHPHLQESKECIHTGWQ